MPMKDVPIEERVFTTGEAAKYCMCSQQTIIRVFDEGGIPGFRVPGSRFRRIPYRSLLKFMMDNGIPTDKLISSQREILFLIGEQLQQSFAEAVSEHRNGWGNVKIHGASSPLQAALLLSGGRFPALVIDYGFVRGKYSVEELVSEILKVDNLAELNVIIITEDERTEKPFSEEERICFIERKAALAMIPQKIKELL